VDGVVKVWNVKKQICLNTFEMSEEKIWALDFCQDTVDETTQMLTGGSDSCVKLWRDCTAEQVLEDNTAKLTQLSEE
jgi:U3 small nucleolar RNA-associated protein 13